MYFWYITEINVVFIFGRLLFLTLCFLYALSNIIKFLKILEKICTHWCFLFALSFILIDYIHQRVICLNVTSKTWHDTQNQMESLRGTAHQTKSAQNSVNFRKFWKKYELIFKLQVVSNIYIYKRKYIYLYIYIYICCMYRA